MNKLILVGCALIMPAALNAQTRVVRTPHGTAVRTPHGAAVRTTHGTTVVRAHPGAWNGRVVHVGVYHAPHGYAYRRWTVGRVVPHAYYAPSYYYPGYAALGLYAPQAHYQWIRYGPDLILVNIRTGSVADIRYGVFG
jgi:Ni/Co efflux regulator RcnB